MTPPLPGTRQRRWAPKRRSGCITCRRRKKKCDEGKPTCQRCLKGGYICDGYDKNGSEPAQSPSIITQSGLHTELGAMAISPIDRVQSSPEMYPMSPKSDYYILLSSGGLNATLSNSSQKYSQYFIVKVAPVLSTTKQWRSFWESIVPCVSTYDDSVHHAMLALSATYESKALGVDRRTEAMHQTNMALRATRSQSVSTANMLILCRLLASISQSTGDWKSAMVHLQYGWKILKEAVGTHQIDANIMRLLGPTFLCASTDRVTQLDHAQKFGSDKEARCERLEDLRLQFMSTLSSADRNRVDLLKKELILIAWSLMTQASCALVCTDTLDHPADENCTSIQDIRTKLAEADRLLTLDELQECSVTLYEDVKGWVQSPSNSAASWPDIKIRLQQFVENFIVQAAEINPNISIGVYWPDNRNTTCDIEAFTLSQGAVLGKHSSHSHNSLVLEATRSASPENLDARLVSGRVEKRRRAYYAEFVCAYRSGLMPAFITWDSRMPVRPTPMLGV